MRPSRVWEWLLGAFVSGEDADAIRGDAAEEFVARAVRDGDQSARRWYRRQAIRSLPPILRAAAADGVGRVRKRNATRKGAGMWVNEGRVALRGLGRRPGFSATIVATLALGVGFTTALFGVYRAVFLEPLGLPESDELVVVMQTAGFGCCGPASGPDYLDWVERNRSFEAMAALRPRYFNLTGLAEAERVYASEVTASAFELLGVEPLHGRALVDTDDAANDVVVLAHTTWTRLFASRPDVVGGTLEINGRHREIVGVMPEGFDVPSPWGFTLSHAFFLPLPRQQLTSNRGSHGTPVIARLRDGVTVEAAQLDMLRVMRELEQEYPATNTGRAAEVFSAHQYRYGDVGRQFATLLAAAGLVLLIACANVAGLLLARSAGREGELAVRTALGASRANLIRLLFTESLLLSALATVVGIGIAHASVDALKSLLPATVPRADQISVDGTVLVFALVASVATALLFGVIPAMLGSRTDVASGVREGGYSTLAPRKERVRDAFIVLQIAAGLVLANGAAVLARSYDGVRNQEHGFATDGVITMALRAAGPAYDEAGSRGRFFSQVLEGAAAVPGVRSVGFVSKLPMAGGTNGNVQLADAPPRANQGEGPLVEVSSVAGEYFSAMGIPLLRGRLLEPSDSVEGSVGVVVNETMANQVWPDQNPIGKQFGFSDDPPWLNVVGVVGSVRQWGIEEPPLAEAYLPYAVGWSAAGYVVARAEGDPAAAVMGIRNAIRAVDPSQPPSDVLTMADRVDRALAQRRFYTTLVGLFAIAALFLASAGIYGTVSYFVSRRVREMGIRMALGAAGTGIVRLVITRTLRLVGFGVALGLLGIWASVRVVEGFVYGISAAGVVTVSAGCLTLALVAIAASALPALRAVRISPVTALRSE